MVDRSRNSISLRLAAMVLAGLILSPAVLRAAEVADAQALFTSGKYSQCIEMCADAITSNRWEEGWRLFKIRSEVITGKYPVAMQSYEAATARGDASLVLRLAGYDVLRANNRPGEALQLLIAIRALAVRDTWRYSDPANRTALGRALFLAGADARQVLELFYDTAKRDDPTSVVPHMATGELALVKQDMALAGEAYQQAVRLVTDDPDVYFGLARSFQNNPERATAALAKALELNPNHVDSLLFQADNLIDQEAYDQAETILKQVLAINPAQPRAWAYRAVLAHLYGDKAREQQCRTEALRSWSTNPEVDYLIGEKISQKYRFAEGETYQRRALETDPTYRPARLQLAQDLLRLGKEDEGWRLANRAFEEDPYSVLAFNLTTLHDNLVKFSTIESEHFIIRMDPRESQIYGRRVLELLEQSRAALCAKYDVQLTEKTIVEVFPTQKDFAIRTFGLPGGAGYLGVCFGRVITANSPASRGPNPTSWEAILWHEFCHAVTLHKTGNKMPRWLSEGISVYEERARNPAWGQSMNPQYREMIMKGEATPVSKLSGAFLKPPTPIHLQFAYYESSMVVQYVVDRFGAASLQKILADLGADMPINAALAKHTEPIDKLDEGFAKWLKEQAEALAPKVDWTRPDADLDAGSTAMAAWNKAHPDNFAGLLGEGRALLAEEKFKEAILPLERAAALYPNYNGPAGPYALLAQAYRSLGDKVQERASLEKLLKVDADSVEPRLRLIELASEQKDFKTVREVSEQVLGSNPLIAAPHRSLLKAAEVLGLRPLAIAQHRTLLLMDPLDRTEHHYQLARLLVEENELSEARREVVLALEQAPRYLAAHQLLLDIVQKAGGKVDGPATQPADGGELSIEEPLRSRRPMQMEMAPASAPGVPSPRNVQ